MGPATVVDLADVMIPAPKRAMPGRGVLAGVGRVTVRVQGFGIDVPGVLCRWGLAGGMPDHESDHESDHELVVERVASPFPGAPRGAGHEAYRCGIGSRRSVIHAATEQGVWRGLATFCDAAALVRGGLRVREAVVDDWPDVAWRGIIKQATEGATLMSLRDWEELVDELARLKMNVLGVELLGSSGAESLMVPVPGYPELRSSRPFRWYSPVARRRSELSLVPPMLSEDFFGALVAYGRSRGVRVVPLVHFPSVLPEPSTASGSDPRDFLTSFCGSIVDRYLAPSGADALFVRVARPLSTPEERGQVARLEAFLVSRGMRHAGIWGEGTFPGVLPWARDPASGFDLVLHAGGSWCAGVGVDAITRRLSRRLAGDSAALLEEAREELGRAAASSLAGVLLPPRPPGRYPLDALETIERSGPRTREELEQMGIHADRALAILGEIEARLDIGTVSGLLADSVRLAALAGAFVGLLDARWALGSGRAHDLPALPAAVASRRQSLELAMGALESRKPPYLVPAALGELTVLYDFLERLEADCAEVAGGRRAPATVRWC